MQPQAALLLPAAAERQRRGFTWVEMYQKNYPGLPSRLGLRTGTEETGPDRPVHPSVHFGPVRPSWTEDRIYVSFIFYKTPQSATCRNPAPPPLVYSVYYYFFCIFSTGCLFISRRLCLVLLFFIFQALSLPSPTTYVLYYSFLTSNVARCNAQCAMLVTGKQSGHRAQSSKLDLDPRPSTSIFCFILRRESRNKN